MTAKVRFAPSPTGRIHVGNIRAAVTNWLFARSQGGVFILRIDDTDLARSTVEYERGIETDLTWLGLTWDEKHSQSQRFDLYRAAAEKLKAAGRLYPAYETGEELDRRRKVQLSRGQPPVYDRSALKLTDAEKAAFEAEGRKPHWRFKLDGKRVHWLDGIRGDNEVDTASLSDPVLIREDGAFLYTLPSVVDDVEMGITAVIRGEDHVTNTGVQIELFEALGAAVPAFAHFSLLTDADGGALSKRLGSLSIQDLREQGYEPLAVVSHMAKLGASDSIEAAPSIQALVESFSLDKYGRAPARYDIADLGRLNAAVLHAMPYAEAKPRLAAIDADEGEGFWNAVRANLKTFGEAADWVHVVRGPVTPVVEDPGFLAKAAELLPDTLDWAAWTTAVKDATGAKGKGLFKPLRLALTGLDHGPEMAALLPVIGKDRILRRLAGETA
jgi:glutamyl-tRNA synthetase